MNINPKIKTVLFTVYLQHLEDMTFRLEQPKTVRAATRTKIAAYFDGVRPYNMAEIMAEPSPKQHQRNVRRRWVRNFRLSLNFKRFSR